MGWYKISQNIAGSDFSGNFIDDIESGDTGLSVKQILDHYDIPYKEISFPKNENRQMDPIISVNFENNTYIIEDYSSEYPQVREANDWIWRINDMYLPMYFYIEEKDFWSGVGNYFKVYHGTKKENIELIKRNGLLVKKDTRGLSNRHTPPAVFASLDPSGTESYGDVVIDIDLAAMKKDGYTPPIEQEEPVITSQLREALAHLIGLEDYSYYEEDSGISSETIVIFGNIPPKYLSFEGK